MRADMRRTVAWIDVDARRHSYAFRAYMQAVAHARYVFRKVHRIVDECARSHGLEPLQHQALIQINATADGALAVGHLADRLSVAPALASRLVRQLGAQGLVLRSRSQTDGRTIHVSITAEGEDRLYAIVQGAHERVHDFRLSLAPEEREATHEIASFYVGSDRAGAGKAAAARR